MRIGFFGMGGTGKTTLVDAMAALPSFSGHDVRKGVMERLKRNGFPINEESGERTQTAAFQQIAYDLLSSQDMIADRTVLDCLAYSMNLVRTGRLARRAFDEQAVAALTLLPTYDRVYHLVPEFAVADNGLRITEPGMYEGCLRAFRDIHDTVAHRPNMRRLSGSVRRRMEQIADDLGT